MVLFKCSTANILVVVHIEEQNRNQFINKFDEHKRIRKNNVIISIQSAFLGEILIQINAMHFLCREKHGKQ